MPPEGAAAESSAPPLYVHVSVAARFFCRFWRVLSVYLTMLGGTAVVSMGFSTALFAVVGALAGVMSLQRRGGRNMFLPVAVGVGLLALLGTEGERTDYAAHVAGLACGLVLGMCEAARWKRGWPALPQIAAFLLALTLPVLAWWRAFVNNSSKAF